MKARSVLFAAAAAVTLVTAAHLRADTATAPINGTGTFSTSSASSDRLNVNSGTATIQATSARKNRGAADSQIAVVPTPGSGTVHVADVTNRSGDSVYTVSGVYGGGTGPGLGGGPAATWNSSFESQAMLLGLSASPSSIYIGETSAVTVSVSGAQPGQTCNVTLGSAGSGTPPSSVSLSPSQVTLSYGTPSAQVSAVGGTPGTVTVGASASNAATSFCNIEVLPSAVSLVAENNITECMEGRDVTFTATARGFQTGLAYPMTFVFHYTHADGTTWTSSDTSWDLVEDNTATADDVSNAPPPANTRHYFDTPIYVTASDRYGHTATSNTVGIRVWELWITKFECGKPWQVVVGENISYEATASSDCTNWVWDMEDGTPDAWNPTGGNAKSGSGMKIPYTDEARASNSWFGDAYGTVSVSCTDGEGRRFSFQSTSISPSQKAKVYFDPAKTVSGAAPAAGAGNEPAWFVFWNQTAAGNSNCRYDHSLPAGEARTDFVAPLPARVVQSVSYPRLGRDLDGSSTLGGPSTTNHGNMNGGAISGIDNFHIYVKHEMQHYADLKASIGAPNPDGDLMAAAIEVDTNGNGTYDPGETDPALPNTHNISCPSANTDAEYRAYWREANVWNSEVGTFNSVDWSKGGKQW